MVVPSASERLRSKEELARGAGAGEGAAAGLRDLLAALSAMRFALAGRRGEAGARREHRILHGVVDLILNRAVARPTACHA